MTARLRREERIVPVLIEGDDPVDPHPVYETAEPPLGPEPVPTI